MWGKVVIQRNHALPLLAPPGRPSIITEDYEWIKELALALDVTPTESSWRTIYFTHLAAKRGAPHAMVEMSRLSAGTFAIPQSQAKAEGLIFSPQRHRRGPDAFGPGEHPSLLGSPAVRGTSPEASGQGPVASSAGLRRRSGHATRARVPRQHSGGPFQMHSRGRLPRATTNSAGAMGHAQPGTSTLRRTMRSCDSKSTLIRPMQPTSRASWTRASWERSTKTLPRPRSQRAAPRSGRRWKAAASKAPTGPPSPEYGVKRRLVTRRLLEQSRRPSGTAAATRLRTTSGTPHCTFAPIACPSGARGFWAPR